MKAILDYWTQHIPAGAFQKVLQVANVVLGVLTVQRGFTNSQDKTNA
jgi:hypothetical protein